MYYASDLKTKVQFVILGLMEVYMYRLLNIRSKHWKLSIKYEHPIIRSSY